MPHPDGPTILAFRRRLMRWYRRVGRDLPWRQTRDPYAVLVSEFMLQQTQVSRVTEYYPRFLERYPTVRHLAVARPGEVREAWEGLGYYRRAANLHRLAQVVVAEQEGRIPRDREELRRLPGVGRYTAGAVATFAYEQATPAVDTNVARVIRRVFGVRPGRTGRQPAPSVARGTGRRTDGRTERRTDGQPAPSVARGTDRRTGGTEKAVWHLAERLVPRAGRPAWTFNQAIMELGALVCTARVARCGECPVRAVCRTGGR